MTTVTSFWTDLEEGQEPPPLVVTPEMEMEWLRNTRNMMLTETDWTQGADVPDSIKLPYQPYRQSLRDITNTYSSVDEAVFPTKP